MSGTNSPQGGLTRRSFLKTTGVAAGAAALAGSANLTALAAEDEAASAAAGEEQIFHGLCRGNCNGTCYLKIKKRGEHVVQTAMAEFDDPQYNRVCSRGLSHVQRIYNPDRIKYPMRRVGERGSGEWERISWDEAIEEICTKWKGYQKEFGNESIAFSTGTGSYAILADSPNKLKIALGASTINNSYDMTHEYALGAIVGSGEWNHCNELTDTKNSKCIIFWGLNGTISMLQGWHFFAEAKQAGTKFITVDVNETDLARRSDEFISVRPGTDAALAIAMMQVIWENDWEDAAFLKSRTVAPFLVKEKDGLFLRQSDLGMDGSDGNDEAIVLDSDGNPIAASGVVDPVLEGTFEIQGHAVSTAYTLLKNRCYEWDFSQLSEICDVSEEDIRKITKMYACNSPSSIIPGYGSNPYVNAFGAYSAMCSLAAITGNIGKPGAAIGLPNTTVGGTLTSKTAVTVPNPPTAGPTIGCPDIPDVVETGMLGAKPFSLKSLYIYKHNMVGNQAERQAFIEAFDGIDLVVVADINMSDTTMYADIVLPVCHWFETEDLECKFAAPYMIPQDKVIDPMFESKNDYDITYLLAKGMGVAEHFDETAVGYLENLLDSDACRAKGITWTSLKENGPVRTVSCPDYVYGEKAFSTKSKRIEFYLEKPTPMVNNGQDFEKDKYRLPYFEPPAEAWPVDAGGYKANELGEKYPFCYTSSRNKMKTHSQFTRQPWLLELYPEPTVQINPQDAAAKGISGGDYVRVFNDRGSVIFRANLHSGCRPGVLIVPKGWQKDQFKEGHYSDIGSKKQDPYVANVNYFDALCDVEKVDREVS